MSFLASPWKLWGSDRIEDKRTVLKLAFSERLAYERGKGFRTPKTTMPFNMLGGLHMQNCEMADNEVVTSNSVFEILEEWEKHLKSVSYQVDDFAVDELPAEEPQP